MIAWKQHLAGYEWLIHQVWYLEVEPGEVIEPKPHLIPNPRAHLLLTPQQQPYVYDSGETLLSGKGSHLLAASEHLLLLDDNPPIKRIGITFRPEGLFILQHAINVVQPVSAINQCQWFDWLTPLFNAEFQQGLWQQNTRESLVDYLQSHFASLSLSLPQSKSFIAVQKAVQEMDKQTVMTPDVMLDVEALASQCACSRRTLERSFKQVVGLSVKQYQKMARLEQMILALYQQQSAVDWTHFSQKFGFSDQSHLIRTLKQQLRKTPGNYMKRRDLTIDIYGDFE